MVITYGYLNESAYRFLFGGTTSGKPVNERSAMQMTAVYACVRILSESIAGLPVHVYRYTDTGGKEKAIPHPLYRLIHDEPNPERNMAYPKPASQSGVENLVKNARRKPSQIQILQTKWSL